MSVKTDLLNTEWAENFEKECGPFQLKEAIDIILNNTINNYNIYYNNETGDWRYAVVADYEDLAEKDANFWLDSFKAQDDAVKFVESILRGKIGKIY